MVSLAEKILSVRNEVERLYQAMEKKDEEIRMLKKVIREMKRSSVGSSKSAHALMLT